MAIAEGQSTCVLHELPYCTMHVSNVTVVWLTEHSDRYVDTDRQMQFLFLQPCEQFLFIGRGGFGESQFLVT